MSTIDLDEVEDRLAHAVLTLTELAQLASGSDAERLLGKAQGVELALSHLREMRQSNLRLVKVDSS